MSLDFFKTASLLVEPLGTASTVQEAWNLLPSSGCGVVLLADRIELFDPSRRSGLLLEADVTDGPSTVMLRQQGPEWRAWRWVEAAGESHRYVEHVYLSSEASTGPMLYRQYWCRVEDDGVQVWTPMGSRFYGFKENK